MYEAMAHEPAGEEGVPGRTGRRARDAGTPRAPGAELEGGAGNGALAEAARAVAAIGGATELEEALPALAERVSPGAAAALVRVGVDGQVALAAGTLELEPALAGAVLRAAADGRAHAAGRLALIPVACDRDRLVLVAQGPLDPEAVDRLAVLGALAAGAFCCMGSRAALRQSAARAAAALSAIRDGVLAVGRDGVVQALNDAGARALGVRREDLLGRRLADLPALAPVAQALFRPSGREADVVALAHGEVVLRPCAHEGGVVTTLRDAPTEQPIAHRMVGSVARHTFEHLVGAAPELLRVVAEARRVADTDLPVLVCGESGTGKEMLAQAIHNASGRSAGPFLGINVTAIPRDLLESELFGYEGGTFTGARAAGRAGKFELAGQGTLLLDEIGDMPLDMQTRLLRVLQERVVQRLGSARDVPVRARIVATTSHDLGDLVEQGRFRLDLYHRLRVVQLRLPALRERGADVSLIADRLLAQHRERTRRRVELAPQVRAALVAYRWPGNVRELHNVIEGELGLLPPGEAVLSRIPPVLAERGAGPPRAAAAAPPDVQTLEEVERAACARALEAMAGNVAAAARALGVAKGTLYAKMRRYGLGPEPVRVPAPAPVRRPVVAVLDGGLRPGRRSAG